MKNTVLRDLIKSKGITAKKCAEDTNISYRTMLRYLNGQSGQLSNYRILADYFDVTLNELLPSDDPETGKENG